ncbi:MAG: hypothetical protein WCH46_04420 [bacterium]
MKKNILLLITLLFSAPALGQDIYWHQTSGPIAGTVKDMTVDSAGRLFVWTSGSGVFKSTNNGQSWELFNNGLPKSQAYLGAATKSGWLIMTNSAADAQVFRLNLNNPNPSWEDITPFGDTQSLVINDILADPSDGRIYIAAGTKGVLRSDDTGKSWISFGKISDTVDAKLPLTVDEVSLLLSSDGNGKLYLAMGVYGAIYESSDKAAHWKRLPARTPTGRKTILSFVALPNGNLVLGTRQKNFSVGGYIFLSKDNATTWIEKYQRPVNTEEKKDNVDKLIYAPATHTVYANAHGPTLRSLDYGETWIPMDSDKRGDEVFSMAASGNEIFQLCEPDGVFVSSNSGGTWDEKNNGILAQYMWGIAMNSKQTIFAVTEYGLWASSNNGDAWEHKPEYGEDYNPSVFVDRKDNIYVGTNKGLYRSRDNGDHLDRIIFHVSTSSSDSLNIINQVGDNPDGKLYCATNDPTIGFLVSPDEGDHWSKVVVPLAEKELITAFAFAHDTILLSSSRIGQSNFFRSIDNGNSYIQIPSDGQFVSSQTRIHPDGSYLALEFGRAGGVYRALPVSNEDTLRWIKIFPPVDQRAQFINTIYYYLKVDLSGNIVLCTDSGMYRTKKGDFSNWYSVSEGLSAHDVPGHFITCVGVVENPISHVFFAASHGLGVFKSIPNLGVRSNNVSPISISPLQTNPNPFQTRTTITFTLKDRDIISVGVYDILGRKVATVFDGFKEAGYATIPFDAASLPTGDYQIILRGSEGVISTWVNHLR